MDVEAESGGCQSEHTAELPSAENADGVPGLGVGRRKDCVSHCVSLTVSGVASL